MYKTCNFTSRPREGARRWALGGQTLVHRAWPGTARGRETGPPSCRSTTWGWTPWRTTPRVPRLATGALNLTSLVGKQPELVRKAERYRLDIWSLYNCCKRLVRTADSMLDSLLPILFIIFMDRLSRHSQASSGGGLATSFTWEWESAPPSVRPWFSGGKGFSAHSSS